MKENSPESSELRSRAEDRISQKLRPKVRIMTDDDILFVINELQVHQEELKIQNEELRTKQNELEESRNRYLELYEKYANLYDFSPTGYFTLDQKTEILEINLTGANMLETERGNLFGKPLTGFIFEEDQDIFYLHRQNVIDTGKRQQCEIRMKKRDDSLLHVRIESILSEDSRTGSLIFRIAVSDISDRVELEKQLRHAQKMESLGIMAGGIAHEFNNILYVILGYAEMLTEDAPEGSRLLDNLEKILGAGKRAKHLVEQILVFSHCDKPSRRVLKLQPLIEKTLGYLRGVIPTTIQFIRKIDDVCGAVLGNDGQIQQVLVNLCINAHHAMREAGGRLEVSLKNAEILPGDALANSGIKPGNYVRLSVSDTGHGISPENIGRIFDPFYTTKQVGEGIGLGLSVVHGIICSHGGEILANSEPGKGSTFHVYFPIHK
jgi:PAS domain S-box-containing protein